MMTLEELAKRFPQIAWHEPLRIEWIDHSSTWGCRVCIANFGLTKDSYHQWEDSQEAYVHIYNTHTK